VLIPIHAADPLANSKVTVITVVKGRLHRLTGTANHTQEKIINLDNLALVTAVIAQVEHS
jgi:hypothetical protein